MHCVNTLYNTVISDNIIPLFSAEHFNIYIEFSAIII